MRKIHVSQANAHSHVTPVILTMAAAYVISAKTAITVVQTHPISVRLKNATQAYGLSINIAVLPATTTIHAANVQMDL